MVKLWTYRLEEFLEQQCATNEIIVDEMITEKRVPFRFPFEHEPTYFRNQISNYSLPDQSQS